MFPDKKKYLACTQFGHASRTSFVRPVLGQENLKNIVFKMRQIFSLPCTLKCLGSALVTAHFMAIYFIV